MADHDQAMLTFVRLAQISASKQQQIGRGKLLILAGAAACRAGWLEVAELCRQLVLDDNKHHLIRNLPSFADAMRDPDFQNYLKQQERRCSYERAEHLLQSCDSELESPSEESSMGQLAMSILQED
jgi:hypothetical protein